MKLLVFCLIIICNVSNNGKASIESVLPTSMNILLPDTTKNTDKSCYRPCKFNVKPRRCQYNFKIEPSIQDDGRPNIVINGMTPGPQIHVCLNDIIVVKVQNKIPGQELTIHWHGVEQKGTPYMDGVPMITQCPVVYGSTYVYSFIASTPGSFFYHADSVLHQSDGIYGSLIVDQPQPFEKHSLLYDFDKSQEHTLLIAATFPKLLSGNLDGVQIRPDSLVVNGDHENYKLFVLPGYSYRLRLINAVAIDCPLVIDVDQHDFVVIASDSKPVKPTPANQVLLYPGERMDVVVRADRESGGYWVKVRGGVACQGLSARGMFLYSGFNYTSMLQQASVITSVPLLNTESMVFGQKLLSYEDEPHVKNVRTIYLDIDRNVFKNTNDDNDYRYLSDAIPKKPFYPAALSLQGENGVVQINNKSFLYPNGPYLLKSRSVNEDIVCNVGEEATHQQPQCMQVLKVHGNEVLELVLVNEGRGGNETYTFHMHGFSMQIVATWQNSHGTPISKKDIQKLDDNGEINRNIINPPLKDTFIVSNKGYTIVRLKPDRGGTWMLECRSCQLYSLPTAILVDKPQSIPKSVIDSLPQCISYKPADLLLN